MICRPERHKFVDDPARAQRQWMDLVRARLGDRVVADVAEAFRLLLTQVEERRTDLHVAASEAGAFCATNGITVNDATTMLEMFIDRLPRRRRRRWSAAPPALALGGGWAESRLTAPVDLSVAVLRLRAREEIARSVAHDISIDDRMVVVVASRRRNGDASAPLWRSEHLDTLRSRMNEVFDRGEPSTTRGGRVIVLAVRDDTLDERIAALLASTSRDGLDVVVHVESMEGAELDLLI